MRWWQRQWLNIDEAFVEQHIAHDRYSIDGAHDEIVYIQQYETSMLDLGHRVSVQSKKHTWILPSRHMDVQVDDVQST